MSMTREDAILRIEEKAEQAECAIQGDGSDPISEEAWLDVEAYTIALDYLRGNLELEYLVDAINKQYPEDIWKNCKGLGGKTLRALRCLEKEKADLSIPKWIKTADKMPTPEDGVVAVLRHMRAGQLQPEAKCAALVCFEPDIYPYWLQLPSVPKEGNRA